MVNRFSSEPKPVIVWLTPPFQKIRLHVHQTLLSKLSYHPRIRCHMVRCGDVTTVLRATILLRKNLQTLVTHQPPLSTHTEAYFFHHQSELLIS